MKFRIGQKVIILKGATSIGVGYCSVGKEGIITNSYSSPLSYDVATPCNEHSCQHNWFVEEGDLKAKVTIGEQLLFKFMEE